MMRRQFADKNNVLLVNITRLGDMLQATPTIAGIKQENPNCKISVLVEKQFADICQAIPNIDEIISLDLSYTVRCLAREEEGIVDAYEYFDGFVKDLKAKNFDYCLNMSSSAYTAMLLKLLGVERTGGWTADDDGYRVIASDWAKLFATSVFHQNRQFNSLNLVDVFRCSADVEQHPLNLLMKVEDSELAFADKLIAEAGFTNTGPLLCIQAGASQVKRQWDPKLFAQLCKILVQELDARILLIGTKKELEIIDPIIAACTDPNVVSIAGKTTVPQLGGVLKRAKLLVTGDTGPMHMSVAVGTPVVSMFLASAYGYETGPYGADNIVLQPVIACGPCNPNKACSKTDCHETIDPSLVASLVALRLKGPVGSLPSGLVDPKKLIVYRTFFDQFGFYDMESLNTDRPDAYIDFRRAYRALWLEDIGGLTNTVPVLTKKSLSFAPQSLEGIDGLVTFAREGRTLINRLLSLIQDPSQPPYLLGQVTERLTDIDREIEQLGFHYPPIGPLSRMFLFAKENISGPDATALASDMGRVYDDLLRRSCRYQEIYASIA